MRAFTVVAAVLAVVGVAVAQSPSSGPKCTYTCPDSDSAYNDLVNFATKGYELVCTCVMRMFFRFAPVSPRLPTDTTATGRARTTR